jgi:hypothetical protein
MTTPDRREWLALLKAELARRSARTEWQAGEDERAREQVIDTLRQMAQRFAAAAPLHPLQIDDMSAVEMLAVNLLPAEMRPVGLPTAAAIWAKIKARRTPGAA